VLNIVLKEIRLDRIKREIKERRLEKVDNEISAGKSRIKIQSREL